MVWHKAKQEQKQKSTASFLFYHPTTSASRPLPTTHHSPSPLTHHPRPSPPLWYLSFWRCFSSIIPSGLTSCERYNKISILVETGNDQSSSLTHPNERLSFTHKHNATACHELSGAGRGHNPSWFLAQGSQLGWAMILFSYKTANFKDLFE